MHGITRTSRATRRTRAHRRRLHPAAFAGLTLEERNRAIGVLQSRDARRRRPPVETIVAGPRRSLGDDLTQRYAGWEVSVEHAWWEGQTFFARKHMA